MFKEYYDTVTKIFILPFNFNEELKDLPDLIFGHYFNQKIDNLPSTLTHLTVGYLFNQKMVNLPLTVKQIKICKQQIHLLKKIPFGCKIIDENNIEIFL